MLVSKGFNKWKVEFSQNSAWTWRYLYMLAWRRDLFSSPNALYAHMWLSPLTVFGVVLRRHRKYWPVPSEDLRI
jgi:hypothetical protein